MKKGEVLDRFRSNTGERDRGSFLSPQNTPYEDRALPYDASKMKHAKYEVAKYEPQLMRRAPELVEGGRPATK